MGLIARFRLWIWRWRRKNAYRNQKGELREFVYLDEVSVYSLIASRLGPIAAEFTETQAKTLEREFSGTLSGSAGVVQADLGPRILDLHTQGSQVLRKSTVQTTFKELYEFEKDDLALKPAPVDTEAPEIRTLADLTRVTEILEGQEWVVDPEELSRGRLLEVEVQLETEPIYHVSTLISTFLEMFEETRNLPGFSFSDHTQVREIEHVLTKLLVGLVPVRGQVIDYKVVVLNKKEWIVHRKLIDAIPTAERPDSCSLFVVGVAEQSLFWKDIRRTLFSKARFRVFCRMAQDGPQVSWMPVKLIQVLETVMPELADQIDVFGKSAFTDLTNISMSDRVVEKKERMRKALIGYSELLASHYGENMAPQDSSRINYISQENCNSYGTQKERYEAFEAISTFVLERFNIERKPNVLAINRELALKQAGLDFSGELIGFSTPNNPLPGTTLDQRLLDTEFIAIYW